MAPSCSRLRLVRRPCLREVGHDTIDDPPDTRVEAVHEASQVRAIFCFPVAGFDALHDGYLFGEEEGGQ